MKARGKRRAQISSTKNIRGGMGVLHFLHFPFRIKYEMIGIRSNINICFRHFSQTDREKIIDLPFGILSIKTLRKLPIEAPAINNRRIK